MKTRAHAHTHTLTTLHHYHCFSWRRVSAFVCNYRGLKWKGRIFKKREEDGWKRGKKERVGQKKTHQYVCDILVTFYRNCCSTPSHTCKKKKKEILWECALQWMASKVLSGVFCTKGKRSFVAGWYGFKNITAMGRGLFRFLSPGLQLGLTPSKQNRLCHL